VCEDLGLSPMYANCMYFNLCIILMINLNVVSDNVILKLYKLS